MCQSGIIEIELSCIYASKTKSFGSHWWLERVRDQAWKVYIGRNRSLQQMLTGQHLLQAQAATNVDLSTFVAA